VSDEPIIRVEGHSELIRCPNTGAVINTATDEYAKFVAKRNKEKQQTDKIKNLEDEISELRELIKAITDSISKKDTI